MRRTYQGARAALDGMRLPAGAALLLLGACAAVPGYQPPDIALPGHYSRHVAEPMALSAADRFWWQDFHDPVLGELIAAALSGNPGLAEVRARITEAEAAARAAGAGQVSGDGRLEVTATDGGSESASLGLSALFDLNGARRADARAARARAEAAAAAGIDSQRLLIADLASAYVDLRFFQTRLAQRHDDLASRRQALSDTRKRLDTGVATELEVLQAGALLAEVEADIPRLEGIVVGQRNRISTLVGVPVGTLGMSLGGGGQPVPRRSAEIGVPADLLRHRPDIRQAERLYAAALADMDAATAARYPTLSLNGVLRAPLGGDGDDEASLGAGLLVPVFSQGALKASERAAAARADGALATWRGAVLIAVEQVESSLAALGGAQRSAHAAEKAVSLNARAVALTREILETGGEATTLDLLDRERDLSNARSLLAQSRRDTALQFIALRTALAVGTGENAAGSGGAGEGATASAVVPGAAEVPPAP